MKTLATPDAALGWRTFDHIEANLPQWDQKIYCKRTPCGTTACFAAWSLLLSGITPDLDNYVRVSDLPQTAMVRLLSLERRLVTVWDAAKALLGLTDRQSVALFQADNSLADLRAAVLAVFGPRPASADQVAAALLLETAGTGTDGAL